MRESRATGEAESADTITVEIGLPATADPSGTAPIEAAVRSTVQRLVTDLALPLSPRVEVAISTAERLLMHINGRRCRMVERRYFASLDQSLHARLADAVDTSPELLLTPAVIAALWSGWGGTTSRPPEAFAATLRSLVRHRVRPDRLAITTAMWSDDQAGRAFEDAMCEASAPLTIMVDQLTHIEINKDEEQVSADTAWLAEGVFVELGVVLGRPRVDLDESLPPYHSTVKINDCRLNTQPGIRPGTALVNDTAGRLKAIDVDAKPVTNPSTGQPAAVVATRHMALLEAAGHTTWTVLGTVILVAAAQVRRHACALLSRDVVECQLGTLADTAAAMAASLGGADALTPVMRDLVSEGVNVRDLTGIVGSLYRAPTMPAWVDERVVIAPASYRPGLPDAPELGNTGLVSSVEAVRMAFAPAVSSKFAGSAKTLVVYLLASQIEVRLSDPTPYSEAERDDLIGLIMEEMRFLPPTALVPGILTRVAARRRLRELIRAELPQVPVLSYRDIDPEFNVQPIARIG
ncbi:FHIPEP family type III secretion protein [Streptomyces sp. V1I1]|uniref:FHIPEP family type III secretion protein n=1 Tax=Streptomyces sp. V1I1 TaxID=3042272 RepID=UPI00277E0A30|nr:FHIPEP family type III secretion protein [Streptomyces sp. V1I1]MDQ0939147.1 flagellar biosynthesis component FlhA [Streptomyces sp. V1I1]